jgi:hypothetical protein
MRVRHSNLLSSTGQPTSELYAKQRFREFDLPMLQRSYAGVIKQRSAVRCACTSIAGAVCAGCTPRRDAETFKGLERWVYKCNDGSTDGMLPLEVAGKGLGFVSQESAELLVNRSGTFPEHNKA